MLLPRPASIIGNYEVVRELGHGSMSVVLLGRQRGLGREVAMKLLRTDIADPVAAARFRKEAEVMARLRHPGIVGVLDLVDYNKMLCIVMEYVPSRALSEEMKARRVPREQAFVIIRDVAVALDHAHRAGVVHRDLKPQNILVRSADGRALLTDFGLALDTLRPAHLTQTGFVVGTPLYMAPEQASGKGPIDAQSDVFSLGVIAFELLTGKNPRDDPSVRTVMKRAARTAVPPPSTVDPTIPVEMDEICLRAASHDRAARYRSAAELADAVERWIRTSPSAGDLGRAPAVPPSAAAIPHAGFPGAAGADGLRPPSAGYARPPDHARSASASGSDSGGDPLHVPAGSSPDAFAPRDAANAGFGLAPGAPAGPLSAMVPTTPRDLPAVGAMGQPPGGRDRRGTDPYREVPKRDGHTDRMLDVPSDPDARRPGGRTEVGLPEPPSDPDVRHGGPTADDGRGDDRRHGGDTRPEEPFEDDPFKAKANAPKGDRRETDPFRAKSRSTDPFRDQPKRSTEPMRDAMVMTLPEGLGRARGGQQVAVVAAASVGAAALTGLIVWLFMMGGDGDTERAMAEARAALERERAATAAEALRREQLLAEGGTGGGEGAGATGGGEDAGADLGERNDPSRVRDARELVRRAELAMVDPDQLTAARDFARQAIEKAPRFGEAHAALARVLTRLDREEEAYQSWDEAFSLEPNLVLEHLHGDLDRRRSSRVDALRMWFERVASSNESNLAAAARTAVRLEGATRPEELGRILDEVDGIIRLDPGVRLAHLVRAEVLFRLGRHDDAIAAARGVSERWPEHYAGYLVLGRLLRMRRRFQDAEQPLLEAQRRRPELAEPLVERGWCSLLRYRIDDAQGHFESARKRAPDAAGPLIGLARVARFKAMGNGLRLNPQQRREEMTTGARLGEDAQRREPERALAKAAAGWGRLVSGDPGGALRAANEAIAAEPWEGDAYRLKAIALIQSKRANEAFAVIDVWARFEPDPVLCDLLRGQFLLGQNPQGEAAFRRAQAALPGDAEVPLQFAMQLFRIGQLQNVQGAQAAQGLLQSAKTNDPRLFNDFCRYNGVNGDNIIRMPPQRLAREQQLSAKRNRAMQAKGQKLQQVNRLIQAGNVVEAERVMRELAAEPPASPLPHVELITNFYLNNQARPQLSYSDDEITRLVLENGRKAVASIEPSGFVEWMPLALSVRSAGEARAGLFDQAAKTLQEAQARLGKPDVFQNQQLDQRARQLLGQVQQLLQNRQRPPQPSPANPPPPPGG